MEMTEKECEELIEKMATEMFASKQYNGCFILMDMARAALAVAEPVIREECARIADREANADTGFEKSDFLDGIVFGAKMIAAAIREGGNEDGKNN